MSENKEEVRKLLRWALFLTDSRLANVVFVARTATALAVDELVPSFRARRRQLFVDFARKQQAVAFLSSRTRWLDADVIDYMVASVGGHWKDLQAVVNACGSAEEPTSMTARSLLSAILGDAATGV